jgi:hypothetical protein
MDRISIDSKAEIDDSKGVCGDGESPGIPFHEKTIKTDVLTK